MPRTKKYTPGQLLYLRISESLRYFLVGAMGLVATLPSDIVSSKATAVTTIVLSAVILLVKALDKAVRGVSDELVDAADADRPE